jgi:4-hydroxybenzoate polyprenyltransferase
MALGFVTASVMLPLTFVGFAALYVILTLLYSLWLKRLVMVDVIVLAGLYTLRIVAGGIATDTHVSDWLMALSLFSFLSLAFGKRYVELSRIAPNEDAGVRGRGYVAGDLALLENLGPTSGYLASFVFTLYLNGAAVKPLYSHPGLLWLICPLLLYWFSRFWILAKRRMLDEDPIVFAIKDPVSLGVGATVLVLAILAT